jgi:hypothetical protein
MNKYVNVTLSPTFYNFGESIFIQNNDSSKYITYHSHLIPKIVAEVSKIFLQGAHVLPKQFSYEEYYRRDMK